jgi:hypothetical protein
VQALPVPSAEAPHPTSRRSDRQRHEQHERQKAGRDEAAIEDVVRNAFPVEEMIEDQVGQKVQRGIEEREQAQHAPEADDRMPAGEPPERGHGKRRQEEPQRPPPGAERDRFDRVCAKVVGQRGLYEKGGWHQRGDKQRRLEGTTYERERRD